MKFTGVIRNGLRLKKFKYRRLDVAVFAQHHMLVLLAGNPVNLQLLDCCKKPHHCVEGSGDKNRDSQK